MAASSDPELLAAAVLEVGAPGAVVAVRAGGRTRSAAAGHVAADGREPLTPAARFQVGSIGKTFLAALVLLLVGNGRLSLDDALDDDVSALLGGGEPPRIRDLLRHTSGLPDYLRLPDVLAGALESPPRRRTEQELLTLVADAPRGETGAWSYASTNYLLVAQVVERVTGSPLRDALATLLLDPLGLTRTELPRPASSVEGTVPGHLPADNPFRPSPDGRLVAATTLGGAIAYAADGLVSTASDVARFLDALLGGELLAPPLLAELTTAVAADGVEADAYGLGLARTTSLFGSTPSPCGPAWGHLGLMLGHTAVALSRRDGTRQVVVLANLGLLPAPAWDVLARVAWSALCSTG